MIVKTECKKDKSPVRGGLLVIASLLFVAFWNGIGAVADTVADDTVADDAVADDAVADDAVADDAVESGRKALRSDRYPWYDRSTDDVRRISPKVPKKQTPQSGAAASSRGWDFFAGGDWLSPVAWIGIMLLLATVVFFLIRAYLVRERGRAIDQGRRPQESLADEVDRVELLPVPMGQPKTDLLTAAGDLYRQGHYSEAIIYLYSHLLLQLDKRNLIRLTKGKTNRQYLREVQSWTDLRGMVETTMVMFEDAFFGNRILKRDQFEAVWNRLNEFEMLVDRAAAN